MGNGMLWPLQGLLLLLRRPRWWLAAVSKGMGGNAILLVLVAGIVWWNWPPVEGRDGLRPWLLALEHSVTAIGVLLLIVLPLTRGRAGKAVMLAAMTECQAGQAAPTAASVLDGPRLLVATLPLRIGWAIIAIAAAWWQSWLGVGVAANPLQPVKQVIAVLHQPCGEHKAPPFHRVVPRG